MTGIDSKKTWGKAPEGDGGPMVCNGCHCWLSIQSINNREELCDDCKESFESADLGDVIEEDE